MYDLLLQVHPTLCTFVLTIRLRVVIHGKLDSEKSIVNTCKMFTLGVDFLAASLPSIPCQVVLSWYLALAVSSTMGSAFLYHVVRERECMQSESVKQLLLDSL